MPKRVAGHVRASLGKARQLALQAVEVYNRPNSPYRTGTYLMLMVSAWTSLFHAVFWRDGTKPYHRDPRRPGRYLRVDGDYKWWECSECVRQYFGGDHPPVRKNLEFAIKLRNRIEHRDHPELDSAVYGECQALLLNFEDMVGREFGDRWLLQESLRFAIQFDRATGRELRPNSPGWSEVRSFIEDYRSALGTEISGSMEYSWQVFLLPKIANHRKEDTLAIEWVNYDALSPEQKAEYEKAVGFIRSRQVPVQGLGNYRPAEVARRVEDAIGRKFSPGRHHAAAWKNFGVRPPNGAADPAACDTRYCVYDAPYKSYSYTEAWTERLIQTFSDPETYDAWFASARR